MHILADLFDTRQIGKQLVVNLIIDTGHWPGTWKLSIIKPLYKGTGDKWSSNSYRPVALISAIARSVERELNEQLMSYLTKAGLNLEENHGFIQGRGCHTAVIEILETLQEGVEENSIPVLLGIDISAAFDCIDRSKVLRQLKILGVGERGIQLIRSYFSNRVQKVEIGGQSGDERPSDVGVLQGSGLSPLLFLLYFMRGTNSVRKCEDCVLEMKKLSRNRKPRCEKCGMSVVYADDLNAISRSKNSDRAELEMNVEMQGTRIEEVLRKIGLLMNKSKTQFLACMSYQRRKPSCRSIEARDRYNTPMVARVGGENVEEQKTLKTLGVTFDSELKFKQYWEQTVRKAAQKQFALNKIRNYIHFNSRKKLGQGVIVSKIIYCIEATSSCPKSVLKGPKKILNRLTRNITGLWAWEDTGRSYNVLGWMPLYELIIFRTYILAKKMLERGDPVRVINRFAKSDLGGTWSVKKEIRPARTETGRRTFSRRVMRLWEELTEDEKSANICCSSERRKIKERIKKLDADWILWGQRNPNHTASQIQTQQQRNQYEQQDLGQTEHYQMVQAVDQRTANEGSSSNSRQGSTYHSNNVMRWTPRDDVCLTMISLIEEDVDKKEIEGNKHKGQDFAIGDEERGMAESGEGQTRVIGDNPIVEDQWCNVGSGVKYNRMSNQSIMGYNRVTNRIVNGMNKQSMVNQSILEYNLSKCGQVDNRIDHQSPADQSMEECSVSGCNRVANGMNKCANLGTRVHQFCGSITRIMGVMSICVVIDHATEVFYRLEFLDFEEIFEEVIDSTGLEGECGCCQLVALREDLPRVIEPG